MGVKTGIAWCDHTFNPWRGCTKISEGCANCYAATLSKRNPATLGTWGPQGTRVVAAESYWRQPIKWNRDAEKAGVRRRVFCASLADVFEDWTGPMVDTNGNVLDSVWSRPMTATSASSYDPLTMSDVRARLFRLIDGTPWLDWLVLTKRPENVLRMWPKGPPHGMGKVGNWPRLNVWLGVTCENQAQADARIPHLLKVPAAVRFLSCEPLLEAVALHKVPGLNKLPSVHVLEGRGPAGIDWVIVGGESGPKARPFDVAWARSLRDQCQAAGVACFVKQLGANVVIRNDSFSEWPNGGDDLTVIDHGPAIQGEDAKVRLRDRAGADPAEWPEDLRVQFFPS